MSDRQSAVRYPNDRGNRYTNILFLKLTFTWFRSITVLPLAHFKQKSVAKFDEASTVKISKTVLTVHYTSGASLLNASVMDTTRVTALVLSYIHSCLARTLKCLNSQLLAPNFSCCASLEVVRLCVLLSMTLASFTLL